MLTDLPDWRVQFRRTIYTSPKLCIAPCPAPTCCTSPCHWQVRFIHHPNVHEYVHCNQTCPTEFASHNHKLQQSSSLKDYASISSPLQCLHEQGHGHTFESSPFVNRSQATSSVLPAISVPPAPVARPTLRSSHPLPTLTLPSPAPSLSPSPPHPMQHSDCQEQSFESTRSPPLHHQNQSPSPRQTTLPSTLGSLDLAYLADI